MITLPPEDLSPSLLEYIVKQQELIAQLQARIKVLENEIIRLKKLNPKPNIKPNTKPPDDSGSDDPPDSGDSGSTDSPENDDAPDRKSEVDKPDDSTRKKRSQPPSPPVSEEHCLSPEDIPEGSVRHGQDSFTVQELEIKAKTVRYWLEQWLTPEGKTISGRPPECLQGHHFGPQLQAFVLLQHYGCAVTQPG